MAGPTESKVIAGSVRHLAALHATDSRPNNCGMLRMGSDDEAAAVLGSACQISKLAVLWYILYGGGAASGDFRGNGDACMASPDRCI